MCVQCNKDLKKCKSRELRASILYTSCDCIKRNGLQDSCPRSECQGQPACMVMPEPVCCPSKHARRYINMRANIGRAKEQPKTKGPQANSGGCPNQIAPSGGCPQPIKSGCNICNKSGPAANTGGGCPKSAPATGTCPKSICVPPTTGACATGAQSSTCANAQKPACPQAGGTCPESPCNRLGGGSDGDGPQLNCRCKKVDSEDEIRPQCCMCNK